MAYDLNDLVKVSGLKLVAQRVKGEIDALDAAYAPLADFTTVQTKVATIAEGAQVNVLEGITVDGTTQTIANKIAALDLSAYAKKTDVASSVTVKGTVANFAALPADAAVGDMYHITAAGGTDENGVAIKAGDNVVKTSTGWDNFGGTIDLSGYVEKENGKGLSTEDFTTALKAKLDAIEAGAQVNIIETVKVNGTALAITDKAVNIDTSGKMDKVSGAVQSNIAIFGANGQVADSGAGISTDTEITEMITDVFGAA